MAKSRREQGLEPLEKEVVKLPLDKTGGVGVVVRQLIPHRPLKLDDLDMVREKMEGYLVYCRDEGKVPSTAGFAVTLGVSKSTLEQGMLKISDAHKEMYQVFRSVIEDWVVQKLFEPKSSIAAIFYLKQLGWRDDRGHDSGGDNRSVTQIYINSGDGLKQIDTKTGGVRNDRVVRKGGRPKKYDGEVMIVPVEGERENEKQ